MKPKFRVVYGSLFLRIRDFSNSDEVLSFLWRLHKKHPSWSIGDSRRDNVSVIEFADDRALTRSYGFRNALGLV